jgi:hypothetical protein
LTADSNQSTLPTLNALLAHRIELDERGRKIYATTDFADFVNDGIAGSCICGQAG